MASSGNQFGNGEYGGLEPCGTDSDATSRQSGADSDGIKQTHRNPQILKWAVTGLAVTSLLATAVYFHGFSRVHGFEKKHLVGLQVTAAANPAEIAIPCTEYPYVKVLSPPFWRNLGQAGPDYGEEGMFFNVTMMNMGTIKEAQLRINAEQGYKPSWNEFNGINGEWVRINFNSGAVAGFKAYFWDKDTEAPMKLPAGYITFSDLDGGPSAKEFVSVSQAGFTPTMFLGNTSGLTLYNPASAPNPFIAQNVDATVYPVTWLYTGKGVDLGKDNPDSADILTSNQKNNGVTFQIGGQGLTQVLFKLGATPGSTSRTIQFNFQPTLLCASTKLPDGSIKTPFDPAYRPKTQAGVVVNSTNLPSFNICTGPQCVPTAAPTTSKATAASADSLTTT